MIDPNFVIVTLATPGISGGLLGYYVQKQREKK